MRLYEAVLTVTDEQSVGVACGCYFNEGGISLLIPFLVKEER